MMGRVVFFFFFAGETGSDFGLGFSVGFVDGWIVIDEVWAASDGPCLGRMRLAGKSLP